MKLSPEAQKLYDKIVDDYLIDDEAGILLLQTACEAFDEMRNAQKTIEKEGLIYSDRFGQPQEHPAAKVARASRQQMMSALKQLNLDLEPLRDKAMKPFNPNI